MLLTLHASLQREMNFCEYLGTFRYAANKFYLKICITNYSSNIKRQFFKPILCIFSLYVRLLVFTSQVGLQ